MSWVPRNKIQIRLWEDKIQGNSPLNQLPELRDLKECTEMCNLETLADISERENTNGEIWINRKVENLPQRLNEQRKIVLANLLGATPISKDVNSRGWGKGGDSYIIFDPKGNQETSFAWGIGETTNNQVEALALWKGILIMKRQNIKNAIVIGDLMIVIRHMVHKTLPKEPHMNRLLHHIQKLIEGFKSVKFYHSLRGLNSLANSMANKAYNIAIGIYGKMEGGFEVFSNLP
jgi:ribonuclease HI